MTTVHCTVRKTKLYLLTAWCRVLLEKLNGLQLVKKFPVFHGTQRFITALTSVRHLSLSWASPIQSIYTYTSHLLGSILILSTHLRLGQDALCQILVYIYIYIYMYLLTPWSRVMLEKVTGSAACKEIPRTFGTRKFITVFATTRHLSLS